MSNASRQAAWRARRDERLRHLEQQFEAEVARAVAARLGSATKTTESISSPAALTDAEDTIANLENQLRAARSEIRTLRSVTMLDPIAVAAAFEGHIAELRQEGQKNAATQSVGATIDCATRIKRHVADWRQISRGDALYRRLIPILDELLREGKKGTIAYMPARVAEMTRRLERQLAEWSE